MVKSIVHYVFAPSGKCDKKSTFDYFTGAVNARKKRKFAAWKDEFTGMANTIFALLWSCLV